jgi:hypothetical protein
MGDADWMFTPWSNATPPEPGWWHTRGEQVRHWDGHAWSESFHESSRYDGAGCLPMPPRDSLAIPSAVTWRWWSVDFFDDTEGTWDVDDCGNARRVAAQGSRNRARAARVESMHEALAWGNTTALLDRFMAR